MERWQRNRPQGKNSLRTGQSSKRRTSRGRPEQKCAEENELINRMKRSAENEREKKKLINITRKWSLVNVVRTVSAE